MHIYEKDAEAGSPEKRPRKITFSRYSQLEEIMDNFGRTASET
jgi:hypothetical protein